MLTAWLWAESAHWWPQRKGIQGSDDFICWQNSISSTTSVENSRDLNSYPYQRDKKLRNLSSLCKSLFIRDSCFYHLCRRTSILLASGRPGGVSESVRDSHLSIPTFVWCADERGFLCMMIISITLPVQVHVQLKSELFSKIVSKVGRKKCSLILSPSLCLAWATSVLENVVTSSVYTL